MTIQFRDQAEFIQRAVAAAQAINPDLSFAEGSPELALVIAATQGGDWLQYLNSLVLAQSRLATCEGEDVDSYMAQFNLTRLPGVPASGQVVFSRLNADLAAKIEPDTLVKTSDGRQLFRVVADYANPAWSFEAGGYVIGVGFLSVSVPVQAVTSGQGGNVKAGTITQRASAIVGVDAVTNPTDFTNGLEPESDDAFKARFARWFSTREKATVDALKSAIDGVQQGLTYVINENYDLSGETTPGACAIFVDDGSGAIASAIVQQVNAAVDKHRAAAIIVMVGAASPVVANVAFTLTAKPGYEKAALIAPLKTAITAYINSLSVGETLAYHKLAQIAYDAVEGVGRVDDLTVNGAKLNIAADRLTGKVVRAGVVTVA